jgi:hypothetical protein
MLGQDRTARKTVEESHMPGDLHAQIEGDGLVQMLISCG